MEYEDKICDFKKYVKQTLDLLVDAYKWKMMSKDCDDMEMKQKYMQVSDTLYNLFMEEHSRMGMMFKEE